MSTPSRARAEAAYDPAGPPPMTRTEHSVGIAMMNYLNAFVLLKMMECDTLGVMRNEI